MKKVLSLVLVIAMVLSSFSMAFAAPKFEDIAETDYEKAINALVGLGVITGYEDGTFRPERVVTRAEMAKLIVEVLGYGDLVAGSKSNFTDTQGHWADPWIALAAGRGLVVGTGDGKFTPDRTVSYDEAITMIVRALGYTDASNELKNMTWPTNFKVKAAELGITKDVKLVSTGADRGGVAQLLYNALPVNMVTVNSDGDVVYQKNGEESKVLLHSLANSTTIKKVEPKHLDKDSKDYKGDIIDLAPYMYQDIDVFVTKDKNEYVVYVDEVNSDILVGEFRRAGSATDDTTDGQVNVRIDGKNKAYDLASTTTAVFYNGEEIVMNEKEMEKTSKTNPIINLHKAAATFVLNDDKEIVGIIADKFTDAARVANGYNGKTKLDGYTLPLDDDDKVDYDKLTVTGAVDSLEDIEEDDVIVLYASAGARKVDADTEKLTIQVVRDTVEGKITRTNSDGDFYINGKYYAASEFAKYEFLVGEEGLYFLDHKGTLVDFDENASDAPKDYAVITEVLDGVFNTRIIADAEMTIVNAKGEEVTYKFDDKAKVDGANVFTRADQTKVTKQSELDVNDKLSANDVIKYTVNSKGKISKITVVENNPTIPTEQTPVPSKTDITGKSYVFANNVVVFNLDGDDVDVVDVQKLGEKVHIIASEKNKNGEIEMFFVEGLGSSATYAYIVEKGTAQNDNDEIVQSIIAYVNGVEVFYEADAKNVIPGDFVDSATITELELDGDIVTGYVATHTAIVTDTVTQVKADRFRVGTGDAAKWYTLADDVAVYILDGGEFDDVGDTASVYYGAKVAGFAFDDDDVKDNIIKVLFIFE